MPNKHGDFIWYELATSNADDAQSFYRTLLGWTYHDTGSADMDYRIISARTEGIGGVLAITDEMRANGARPAWFGYLAVDDVDAAVAAISQAGGSVVMPATDVPGAGRIAMVGDPQGALFYVMKPMPPADKPDMTSNAFSADRPRVGHCAWNELYADEPAAAITFYAERFGWRKDSEMDMGPMGTYEFLRHDHLIAGVMKRPAQMPVCAWCYYFRVPDVDVAVAAIKAGGGQILSGPDEIPGGEFALMVSDPQGAAFGLVGARKGDPK